MSIATLKGVDLEYEVAGNPQGAPVVFAHALGTDLHMWDALLPHLPPELQYIRFSIRGHGQSSCPDGPYSMGTLVRDTEQLLDHLQLKGVVFVGLSLGGMIAQGLAVKRLDLVRALVLSNTAAKIGQASMWHDRIDSVRQDGMQAITGPTLERWFSKAFRATPDLNHWRDVLLGQSVEGYAGCAAAIAGTDFYTPTSGLRLPTLGIAASEDRSTPPDLVRETVDLIHGSKFALIRRAGHLPCVEDPETYAAHLTTFLKEIGHV
ncbi:3-oxoadipate enol-lactonase [Shimia litoralis]|uniref:3-oxoadipate enol-lactonase n=1 Tax=Shimia litoralis TaxID=420403 RepID=A0A4U7N9D0_9RHOB|nr:3-oxoadipate enol-lactonase [Shimia litoralis]TKZ22590.1 3-oxoadipate enol-lactonase [Shimia litoralis]